MQPDVLEDSDSDVAEIVLEDELTLGDIQDTLTELLELQVPHRGHVRPLRDWIPLSLTPGQEHAFDNALELLELAR